MTHQQFSVTTTPVKVFTGPGRVALRLGTGAQSVYIGDSSVTSATGYPLFNGNNAFEQFVSDDSEVWAVTSTGTGDLRVLSWY